MFRIFHSAMIAYFAIVMMSVVLGGAMAGCGYRANPYYERSDSTKQPQGGLQGAGKQSQINEQDSQPTLQSVKSIHSASLSEDDGD
ncbi:hypothetical protein [uncultured Helicobacter sp.]|uniref:hypothetical protein n=1 Tax=uncultured Helicobacter sp. TaxID=175537 RepID=UPI0037513B7A